MADKKKKLDDDQIAYLQSIQRVIDRMSTTSAVFKGFASTIIAGITAISFTKTNEWILLFAFLPILCFFALDIYYFYLEKRYRELYEDVRIGKHDVDFDLALPTIREGKRNVEIMLECFKSPSVFLFYIPLIFIAVIVIMLKFKGEV